MELRTTEEKINELLAAYEGIRGSSILQPEQEALLPSTPTELVAAAKAKAGASTATIVVCDQDSLVRSLRNTKAGLVELRSRVEKIRKRLFEIDPVTEKPRYGPKSQARVQLLVARNEFLCSRYDVDFPKQQKNQGLKMKQYRQHQLELQEQRQEQRRREHLKQEELLKQEKEQENEDDDEDQLLALAEGTMTSATIHANMNPDGSIIITQNVDVRENNFAKLTPTLMEASPASLLFVELEQQHELHQQENERQEASKENTRLREEEDNRRRRAEEETRQKALEAQQAADQAAEEAVRTQRLHQQAEEARLRRRAQEQAQKDAEREWLDGIQKGTDGVKHYLDVLLQRSIPSQEQGGKDVDGIDPDRTTALQSLCTLFEQIQKHPEEVNKRKIKLSNPNFHRDIGRHEGGIQLLVAAGFRPTMLPVTLSTADNVSGSEAVANNDEGQEEQPEIAFLVSKEPNLEHDMDGWMVWFDLNKATLEILQTELQKSKGSKRSRR